MAHGEAHRCGAHQLANRFRRRGAQAQIRRQRVGGSQRHNTQSHGRPHKALQNFMDSAIPAAGQNRVAAPLDCLLGQRSGVSARERFQRLGFNACVAEDGERLVDGGAVACRVLAGSRVVDERNATHREFLPSAFSIQVLTKCWAPHPFRS